MKVKREPVAAQRRGLTKPQEEVIDALAHVHVVADIERNVEGFDGYFDFYQRKTMTPKQRRIWMRFQQRIQEVRRDMVRLMKEQEDETNATP